MLYHYERSQSLIEGGLGMRIEDWVCIECAKGAGSWFVMNHPSMLCQDCYDLFKQRLRDGEVQGVE